MTQTVTNEESSRGVELPTSVSGTLYNINLSKEKGELKTIYLKLGVFAPMDLEIQGEGQFSVKDDF